MHHRGDFLDGIRACPAEMTARLAFADWLDERGDPDSAREAVAWRESCSPETRLVPPGVSLNTTMGDHWQVFRVIAEQEREVGSFPNLAEAVFGFVRWWLNGKGVPCPWCGNTGTRDSGGVTPWGTSIDVPCSWCKGSGWEPKSKCEHEFCLRAGDAVTNFDGDPDGHYCDDHAREQGFCPRCRHFSAGIGTFEVNGFCDECLDEIRHENDPEDDDEWQEEGYGGPMDSEDM